MNHRNTTHVLRATVKISIHFDFNEECCAWHRRDGSVDESVYCSCMGPEFNSIHVRWLTMPQGAQHPLLAYTHMYILNTRVPTGT